MTSLSTRAEQECVELEAFLYEPGGAFEQLREFLIEEGSYIGGLSYALRTAAAGAIRLSGHLEKGLVVDLGKSEEAIVNNNWRTHGLIPRNGPLSTSHQLHINRPNKPLVLCPVRQSMAAGELLISPASPLERLEFSQGYHEFIREALRRIKE